MKAMMFKRGFGDETKWKEVCAELGLPEDTEQVELSVSATKVRTSQNRSWEATDEEMSRIWERLGSYFLRCESISRTNIRVFCGGGDSFSVVRGTTQPGFVEVDGRLMDYEDFEACLSSENVMRTQWHCSTR